MRERRGRELAGSPPPPPRDARRRRDGRDRHPSVLGVMAPTLPRRRKIVSRRGGALSFLAIATIAAAYTALPPLTGIAGRLSSACAAWITLAGALEALSALGFVLVFKLIFGARLGWRQGLGAGLRALGATTLLPAGRSSDRRWGPARPANAVSRSLGLRARQLHSRSSPSCRVSSSPGCSGWSSGWESSMARTMR